MRPEEIQNALKTVPFRPFRARFPSGQTIEVRHPEFVALSPSARTAIVFHGAGTPAGDAFDIVDVMLIEALEFLPQKKNGRRKAS